MNWIKLLSKTLVITVKRLYDLLAAYLLFWVLYLAGVSVILHQFIPLGWRELGVENPALVWGEMAHATGLSESIVRLLVIGLLHLLIFVVVRRSIASVQPWFEDRVDEVAGLFSRLSAESPRLRFTGELLFSLIVTALLVPFVVQPTLVRGTDADAWLARGANLADGSAVVELRDSVYGFYGRIGAEPVAPETGVRQAEVDEAIEVAEAIEEPIPPSTPGPAPIESRIEITPRSAEPIMDRWDDELMTAVEDDPQMFAYVKAFMYVESAGRQYAVSRTGCAGLMQFCSGTAKSAPYKQVFGTGQVYACECKGRCEVPRDVQRALESGALSAIEDQKSEFPCELTDGRFDPPRALRAGSVYVERLHRAFEGNIYLMYIGYNSGPAVAKRLWVSLERNPEATIEQIEQHLPSALRPYYGSSSDARARSLVRVHLPKIARAHQRYTIDAPVPIEAPDALTAGSGQQQLPEVAAFTVTLDSGASLASAGAQSKIPRWASGSLTRK